METAHLQFVQNFPFFCILLMLICAVATSVLKGRAARGMTLFAILAVFCLNLAVLRFTLEDQSRSFVYLMGHFPAPWGNELRVGLPETMTAQALLLIVLLAFVGGLRRATLEIEESKLNIYCILVDLCVLSLLALIYTNDLFTAYVFIEINTLAAAGLIMMRQTGHALVGSVRYMIMNLLGSSLFLIGVVFLYSITGHLLMSPIQASVAELVRTGEYRLPLSIVVGFITVGLAMKSALYPFEKWLPGAYGNSTPTAAALLSSVVSKGYIFLLIKVYVRVIGLDVIRELGVLDIAFVLGAVAMVMGSVNAIRTKTTRMMIAYSSVAQIGYIFLALGLGTTAAFAAALWHLVAHAATKSMLFIANAELDDATGRTHQRTALRGAFYRSPLAAFAFALGGCGLVGVPLLSVFLTKIAIAQAALDVGGKHMIVALAALIISTVLNAKYFLGTALELFTRPEGGNVERVKPAPGVRAALVGFILFNLLLGVGFSVIRCFALGLNYFG